MTAKKKATKPAAEGKAKDPTDSPGPGRPSMFTPTRVKAILDAIKIGMYEAEAARLAGLTPAVVSQWKARGRREKQGEYFDFLNAIIEAELICEYSLVTTVRKESRKNGRLALEMLSRKFPTRWARKDRIKVMNDDDPEETPPASPSSPAPEVTEANLLDRAQRAKRLMDALDGKSN